MAGSYDRRVMSGIDEAISCLMIRFSEPDYKKLRRAVISAKNAFYAGKKAGRYRGSFAEDITKAFNGIKALLPLLDNERALPVPAEMRKDVRALVEKYLRKIETALMRL